MYLFFHLHKVYSISTYYVTQWPCSLYVYLHFVENVYEIMNILI